MLRPWQIAILPDAQGEKPIYLQIADAIIKDIQSGRLRAGDALPGSRSLSGMLKVNRNTVVEALNVLLLEGWLVSRERRGTFVADLLPAAKNPTADAVKESPGTPEPRLRIVFDDGHPNSRIAPIDALARSYRTIFQRKGRWQLMSYTDPLGDPAFREQIAQMLNHQRSMQTAAHEVCITRGSQMGMYLTAQCLLKPGDCVLVENPGYQPAWKAFEAAGATLLPVGVDEEGLRIDDLLAHLAAGNKITAIYTTPHRQYPTTVTLSLRRRQQLVALSNEHGFWIIEDDYDNEFHFGYRPVLPLASMPGLQRYVYIGTFSKVVAPALRIGFLVTKDGGLTERIAALRRLIDIQGDVIMEQAVLELIKDGTIRRHIRKAHHHYEAKRDFMAALLSSLLRGKAEFRVPEGGLAFWIRPLRDVNWPVVAASLRGKGIGIATPDAYSFGEAVNGLRLGYGSLSEEQLKEGLQALAKLL